PRPSAADSDWAELVAHDGRRRPWWWRTEETSDLVSLLEQARGAVLVDCLGAWLSGVMERHGMWDRTPPEDVDERIEAEVHALIEAWRTTQADRKSTRLNSSHVSISYAVVCLKKKI